MLVYAIIKIWTR